MRRPLLIMGPTASGKSALALALAERLGGEIVNADSMQVYRDLRILSARPSEAEAARAPHHLFGHVDGAERYSTGRWLPDAAAAISAIQARGRTPILVGGTGLYFKALTEGLSPAPPGSPEIRARLTEEFAIVGARGLHARLADLDPAAAARLRPTDSARLIRALEVIESGASSTVLLQKTPPVLTAWHGYVLAPDRAALYRAIEARLDQMVSEGVLEEVRVLIARGLAEDLPVMKAHGVPPLRRHLQGELNLAEAVAQAKQDTRRYAKRQFTWIAHQLAGWRVLSGDTLAARLEETLAAERD